MRNREIHNFLKKVHRQFLFKSLPELIHFNYKKNFHYTFVVERDHGDRNSNTKQDHR